MVSTYPLESSRDGLDVGSPDPGAVLEKLEENDVITGDAWTAWSTAKDTPARPICKVDDGVENKGLDKVLQKIHIRRMWQKDPPVINVTLACGVPQGFKLTGLVALAHDNNGTGAKCIVKSGPGDAITVTHLSQEHRGINSYILVIGRNVVI